MSRTLALTVATAAAVSVGVTGCNSDSGTVRQDTPAATPSDAMQHSETPDAMTHSKTPDAMQHSKTPDAMKHSKTPDAMKHSETPKP